jgi:hypothetical protein
MPEVEISLSKRDLLALVIAQGKSITGWARQNEVPRSTAYRWASQPDCRRQVEDWRRRFLDRALGYMTARSMRAVKGIAKLADSAESESVQLRAWRAVLSDQMAVSKHVNLEYRIAEIEEEIRVRNGKAAHPG